jgi:O-antigen ligase
MLVLACISVSGLTESVAFSQPSTLKYLITVLGPLAAAAIAMTKRYDLVILSMAIFVAPFNYVTTLSGFSFTPLQVLLIVGLLCSRFGPQSGTRRRPTLLMTVGLVFALTLLGPLVRSEQRMNEVVLVAVVFAMAYLVATSARDPQGRNVVMASFIAACAVQGAIGVWEFLTHHQLNLYSSAGSADYQGSYFFQFQGLFRVSAAFPNPIAMGNVLAMSVPILIALVVAVKGAGRQALLFIAGLCILFGAVATLSRSSWLAIAVGAVIAMAFLGDSRVVKPLLGFSVVGVLAIVAAENFAGPALLARANTIFGGSTAATGTSIGDFTRHVVQGGALQVFRSHPLTGVGLGNLAPYLGGGSVRDGQNAQNYLYQMLAEAGFLAGASLLAALGALAWVAIRALIAYRTIAAMLLAEIAVIAVVSSTDANFRYAQVSAFVAVLFGLGASLGTSSEVRAAHAKVLAGHEVDPTPHSEQVESLR